MQSTLAPSLEYTSAPAIGQEVQMTYSEQGGQKVARIIDVGVRIPPAVQVSPRCVSSGLCIARVAPALNPLTLSLGSAIAVMMMMGVASRSGSARI